MTGITHSLLISIFFSLLAHSQASNDFTRLSAHHKRASALSSASSSLSKTSAATPKSKCDVSSALLAVPGQGDVNPTPGDVLQYIALGIGSVQYECKADKSWSPVGQRGVLYDASCLYDATSPDFLGLATNALTLPASSESLLSKGLKSLTGKLLPTLGTFYLHETSPKFDMRQRRGGAYPNEGDSGYIIASIEAEQSAPVASYNVDWRKYTAKEGGLASSVFRVATAGGVPAHPLCTPGQTTSVPLAAQYWFFADGGKKNQDGTVVHPEDAPKSCDVTPPSKDKKRAMSVMLQSVIYGDTGAECKSIEECSKLCLADTECEGWVISTEDGEGATKKGVDSNEIIFSTIFNAGIVRQITGTEYIDRYGVVQQCPDGLVTSEVSTGCVAPVCN